MLVCYLEVKCDVKVIISKIDSMLGNGVALWFLKRTENLSDFRVFHFKYILCAYNYNYESHELHKKRKNSAWP